MFRNSKNVWAIALLAVSTLCPSCLKDSETSTQLSSDPTVAALTFGENDSIPQLSSAVFTINSDSDPGLIYNVDSLPVGTRIDSVFPAFSFTATVGAAILYVGSDTVYITGNDTVDFSQQPVRLHVISQDGSATKDYEIYVNVHQVEPELYVWNQLADNVYTHAGSMQKALAFDNQLFWYINTGVQNYLYTSPDGAAWTPQMVSGLPAYGDFVHMQAFQNTLYYADKATLYSSANGTTWTANDFSSADFTFVNLLYQFTDSLWSIVQNKANGTYHIAASADALAWKVGAALPADFPVEDYAAIAYVSPTLRPQALILGGTTATGQRLNTRWLTENGRTWLNMSVGQPSFGSLAGASVVFYDKKLLMFGGSDSNDQLLDAQLLQSQDDGLTWQVPDSTYNYLPVNYQARTRQSAFVSDDGMYIYLLGGQTRTTILRDVWRGKLNRIDW